MKTKNIAWMGAGLLLAGVAGVVLGRRRKMSAAMPVSSATKPTPKSPEYTALREILDASVAYNDSLYARVKALTGLDEAARPAAVSLLTEQNQTDRAAIDAKRETLQKELAEQGRTFADVDGFVDLISEYRRVTLRQQKKHLQVYEQVRTMKNVPQTPELHAYLKLGFKEDDLRHADTAAQVQRLADEQRELMLRAGRMLAVVTSESAVANVPDELKKLGDRYNEIVADIKLYREDDGDTVMEVLPELKTMYDGLLPTLRSQVERLREADFYGDALLRDVLERLLPPSK